MEQSEVMVTVLCICFNHAKTLRRALDSFVSQETDFAYRILIHDDASTDGSQEIIREYQERYPHLIRTILQKENQYSQGLLHVGQLLAAAEGKYVAYCETDDYWTDPHKLQLQFDALEAHPDCTFCVHNTQMVDTEGKALNEMFPPIKLTEGRLAADEYIHHELYEGKWMFQLSSFMFRRDVMVKFAAIEKSGFPGKYYRVGDQPMFLFFVTEGDCWYIDRDMSCYRVDSGGFMSRIGKDNSFLLRAQWGYINGLKAFDEYSKGEFAESTHRAILRRELLCDIVAKNYKALSSDKYYDLRDELGVRQRMKYRLLSLLPSGRAQDDADGDESRE